MDSTPEDDQAFTMPESPKLGDIERGDPREAIEAKHLGRTLRERRRRKRLRRRAIAAAIVICVLVATPRVVASLQDSRTFPAIYCADDGTLASDGRGWADWVVARFGSLLDTIGVCSEYELPN